MLGMSYLGLTLFFKNTNAIPLDRVPREATPPLTVLVFSAVAICSNKDTRDELLASESEKKTPMKLFWAEFPTSELGKISHQIESSCSSRQLPTSTFPTIAASLSVARLNLSVARLTGILRSISCQDLSHAAWSSCATFPIHLF